MPEIAEGIGNCFLLQSSSRHGTHTLTLATVARIVYFIRKTLVGKTLSVVKAQDDANVFGKVGTSAAEFQAALTGKKVISAGQQGKYFWMIMSEPPHPVMHFGMTGEFGL